MRLHVRQLSVAFLLLGGSAFATDIEDMQAEKLLTACEQYRESHYQFGFMRIKSFDVADNGTEEGAQQNELMTSIWFDDECLRNDINNDRQRNVVCHQVYINFEGASLPVTIAPTTEYEDAADHFGLFHPRWIGMGNNSPSDLAKGRKFRCLMFGGGGKRPTVTSLEKASDKDVEVWKIEYYQESMVPWSSPAEGKAAGEATEASRTTRRQRVSYWIAPAQGYGLIRMERDTSYPDKELQQHSFISTTYEHDGSGDVWFPRESVRIHRQNGKIMSGQRFYVEEASFQRPSADSFTISALGLSVDQRICDRTKGGIQEEYVWNGKSAVRIPSATDPVARSAPVVSAQGRSWILWINAVVLVSIAAFAMRFRRAFNRHRENQ